MAAANPPGEAHGIDVDEHGYGAVTEQRLYQLIRRPGAIVERTVEIEFLNLGAGPSRLRLAKAAPHWTSQTLATHLARMSDQAETAFNRVV